MPTLANHSLGHAPDSQKRNQKPRRVYFWRRLFFLLIFVALIYGVTRGAFWVVHRTTVAVRTFFRERPTCDVLVVGGTPSGIAAALSAARAGSHVILLEERPKVGGDIPYAFLNMFDVPLENAKSNQSPVAYGIFGEVFQKLGVAFDIKQASKIFEDKLTSDKNISVRCKTHIGRVLIEEGRIAGVVAVGPKGQEKITASAIVDATNDAQFAARAGAGYSLGREIVNADKRMQAAGLLFSVQGVNWEKVRYYVRQKKTISLRRLKRLKKGTSSDAIDVRVHGKKASLRLGGVIGRYAWERGNVIKDYEPKGKNIVVLSINFGRQDDGSVVLNTLNVVGVNGLSAASCEQARKEAIAEIPRFLNYLRHRMPGFEKARLAHVAPELYIRETRHIYGFHTLDVADIKRGVPFWDRVSLASYPLDLHPYKKDDHNPFGPQRYVYAIPLRCLVPRKVDGIFVASRSLSATYSAAGSARVIPITMAAGEAVGTAAAMCASEEITPHQLVKSTERVAELQKALRAYGMNIGDGLVNKKAVTSALTSEEAPPAQ